MSCRCKRFFRTQSKSPKNKIPSGRLTEATSKGEKKDGIIMEMTKIKLDIDGY